MLVSCNIVFYIKATKTTYKYFDITLFEIKGVWATQLSFFLPFISNIQYKTCLLYFFVDLTVILLEHLISVT